MMKKIFYSIAFTLGIAFNLASQTCNGDISNQYTSSQGWTTEVATGTGYVPVLTPSVTFNNGSLSIFTGNEDYIGRAYRNLRTTLCNSFIAEIEYNERNLSTVGREAGSIVMAFTADDFHANGLRDSNNLTQFIDPPSDQLMVVMSTARSGVGAGLEHFKVIIWDDGTKIDSDKLNNLVVPNLTTDNSTYTVVLERINGTNGRLTITNQSNNVTGSICFQIPATVNGLNFVQHSGNARGGDPRIADFTVDNLCINNCEVLDDCCFIKDFQGPNSHCLGVIGSLPVYTADFSANATYNWSINGGVNFTGQGTNSITPNFTSAGTYTITLEITCGCETTTISKTVQVGEGIAGNFSINSADNGTSYTSFSTSALNTGAGYTHSWAIYEGADCGDPSHPIANPTPIYTGQGATWTITNTSLLISRCYVVQHIISDDQGACPDVEFRRHLSANDSETGGDERRGKMSGIQHSSPLSVFPNPANNKISIFADIKGNARIQILDASGKLVKSLEIEGNTTNQVDISNLKAGLYSVSIESKELIDSMLFTKK